MPLDQFVKKLLSLRWKSLKVETKILLLVLLVGFALRVWGIFWGLPYSFYFDEGLIIYTTFYAARHSLMPNYYLYLMFFPELLMALYGLYYVFGELAGFWSTLEGFSIAYLANPSALLLLGRILMVFFSTLTIWLIYYIGKKIYNQKIGLIGAFFLSLAFLTVQESHFIKEDTLVGFLSLLLFYANYKIVKNERTWNYFFAGLVLGLLAAVRYNFVIFIPGLLLANLITISKKKKPLYDFFNKKLLLAMLTTLLIFFAFNPYFILNSRSAFAGVLTQFSILTSGGWVNIGGRPAWFYYLDYHLRYGLGTPLFITSGLGILYLIFLKKRSLDWLLIISPFSFFLTLILVRVPNFSRYAVAIIPFLVLPAAIVLHDFINVFRLRSQYKAYLMIFLSLIVMAPSFIRIVKLNYYLTRPDTRVIAKDWVEKTIPTGTRIVNEGNLRAEYPSVWGPPLVVGKDTILTKIELAKKYHEAGTYLNTLLKANEGKEGYNMADASRIDRIYLQPNDSSTYFANTDYLVSQKYCWLITSNWASGDQTNQYSPEFSRSLKKNYELVKQFIPTFYLPEDPVWRIDFSRLDQFIPLITDATGGPVIKIYRMRDHAICP